MTTTVKQSFSDNKLPEGSKTLSLFQLINWIARPFDYLEQYEKKGD